MHVKKTTLNSRRVQLQDYQGSLGEGRIRTLCSSWPDHMSLNLAETDVMEECRWTEKPLSLELK